MMNPTDLQITERFATGRRDLDALLAPLVDLTHESSSLVLGYGMPQAGVREKMIPYFHVCGTYPEVEPLRALVIGGWAGNEDSTPLAVARLLAAMEARLSLVDGLEITAYPVANPEAHRDGVTATREQKTAGMACWTDSPASPVRVMENELKRYDYDAVIVLRESSRATRAQVDFWPADGKVETVLTEALRRQEDANLRWRVAPEKPVCARAFTPVPDATTQPTEVVLALPGTRDTTDRAATGLGLLLGLLHALRQARQEGVL
jgi:hypothetical protein